VRARISRHLGPVLSAAPGLEPDRLLAESATDTDTAIDAASDTTVALARRLARPAALAGPSDRVGPVPPEFSGRDYTIFLLRIAAEVEHTLMVQYLFAAYSLGGPDVPDSLREQVRAWQETILGVAKEEMGHLITVQNLLTVLGAARQFDRDDYPSDSPLYPFGFRLEPLSLNSLAAYICAESPADWNDAEAAQIKARAQADTGDVVNRVGALFDQLITLFEDPAILPDNVFQPDTRVFQAGWDEWGRGYREDQRGTEATSVLPGLPAPELVILPADSRAAALVALRAIAEQGEGLQAPEDENDSHFVRFLTIYRALDQIGPDAAKVVRPVATNPVAGDETGGAPGDPDTPTPISHPEAVLWAHLFNVRYRKLLVSLSHAFELAGDLTNLNALSPRGWLIHRTFGEMYNLRAIAGLLVRLPLRVDDVDGPRAGPPFQMPYSLGLPSNERNRWRVHRDLLDAAAALYADLRAVLAEGSEARDYLTAVAQLDQIERVQVEQLITPAAGSPTP